VNRGSFLERGVAKIPAFLVGGGNNKAGLIVASCWLLETNREEIELSSSN
jgi:hypothetical protein